MTYTEWVTFFGTEDMETTLATSGIDDTSRIHLLVYGICLSLLAIIGLFDNGLVIVSVITTKKLQTPTNILVANLALADFLACAVFPSYAIAAIIIVIRGSSEFPLPLIISAIIINMVFVSMSVSRLTLLSIAAIRWYVITKSIRGHQGFHTPRKVTILSVIIWTFSSIITPLLFTCTDHFNLVGLCIAYDPNKLIIHVPDPSIKTLLLGIALIIFELSILGTFYALILRFVLRHNRRMRAMYRAHTVKSRRKSQGNAQEIMFRREIEITKNLFLVVCIFALCWCPILIYLLIPDNRNFYLYSLLLCASNSVVNPIIYGWRHPIFREVFKKILCHSSEPLKSVNI